MPAASVLRKPPEENTGLGRPDLHVERQVQSVPSPHQGTLTAPRQECPKRFPQPPPTAPKAFRISRSYFIIIPPCGELGIAGSVVTCPGSAGQLEERPWCAVFIKPGSAPGTLINSACASVRSRRRAALCPPHLPGAGLGTRSSSAMPTSPGPAWALGHPQLWSLKQPQ